MRRLNSERFIREAKKEPSCRSCGEEFVACYLAPGVRDCTYIFRFITASQRNSSYFTVIGKKGFSLATAEYHPEQPQTITSGSPAPVSVQIDHMCPVALILAYAPDIEKINLSSST